MGKTKGQKKSDERELKKWSKRFAERYNLKIKKGEFKHEQRRKRRSSRKAH